MEDLDPPPLQNLYVQHPAALPPLKRDAPISAGSCRRRRLQSLFRAVDREVNRAVNHIGGRLATTLELITAERAPAEQLVHQDTPPINTLAFGRIVP